MMGLSLGHILVLSVIVLLFGGRRIPELASGLGRGIREFRVAVSNHSPKEGGHLPD